MQTRPMNEKFVLDASVKQFSMCQCTQGVSLYIVVGVCVTACNKLTPPGSKCTSVL